MTMRTLLPLALLLSLAACKKDEKEEPTPPPSAPVTRNVTFEATSAGGHNFAVNLQQNTSTVFGHVVGDTSVTYALEPGRICTLSIVLAQAEVIARIKVDGVVHKEAVIPVNLGIQLIDTIP